MKHYKQVHNPAKRSTPSTRDAIEQKNIAEIALCHLSELIGLAQDIVNNMHSGMAQPEAIAHISGRLGTLMHCAQRELEDARQERSYRVR